MKYRIGIDIGIGSVGFATMLLDEKDEPCRILDIGSRIFDAAENPKDGASLALPRRMNRGGRRRNRRHRHRLERIKRLINDTGLMSEEKIILLYDKPNFSEDVYALRVKALDKILTEEEFVRVLIHLAQRRGFKSNRKVDAEDKASDAGKLIKATRENDALMAEKGYRTVGEMLYKDEKFAEYKRNKSENYSNTVTRADIEKEIHLIFEAQRKYKNKYAGEDFENKYSEILLSQRSFDDGPGKGSKYGGDQILKMLGKCSFEPGENRAFKAQFSFEYFNLLQKINSIRIGRQEKRPLTEEERKKVTELAFSVAGLKYSAIRKALSFSDSERFNISYGKDDDFNKVEQNTKFTYLQSYHKIKKAFGDSIKYLSKEKLNDIGYVLSAYKNDEKIFAELEKRNFSKEEIAIALTIPAFSKTGNISVKACDKMIPYLEQGYTYDKACEAAGYNFKRENGKEKSLLLPSNVPEFEDITNPVVRRAVSQTIKVVNALIRKYGESPCFISVELARELSRSFADRKEIEKEQKQNGEKNEKLRGEVESNFGKVNATAMDLQKLRLWQEQDGVCPYSLNKIEYSRIFEAGYVDIDHIIPYSISFNDSMHNKVLVLSSENRQKGNRVPLEYIKDKDKFIVWVEDTVKDRKKREFLLKENISQDEREEFKDRNLNDTKYISRFIYNYLRTYLQMQPNDTGKKKTVFSVNGAVTSYMRKRWGIRKIRENGDTHHAVDAAVIACTTDGMIRAISRYSENKETEYTLPDGKVLGVNKKTGEVYEKFPLPYPSFRDELVMRSASDPMYYFNKFTYPGYNADEVINPIFVSRMPKHKNTGAAHKETVRSAKEYETGYKISKVALKSLKLDKDGEIENYYNPGSDILLYDALKKALSENGGNAKKAFAENFYKPKSDGTPGPLVKKVKLCEKATLSVSVEGKTAIADNGSMIRIDVFNVQGEGYYMVPIYVADTVKKVLPNKAVVANKNYSQWKEMDDKNFVFSLYPGDLIKVTAEKEMKFSLCNKDSTLDKDYYAKEFFAYYVSTNISVASVGITNHDRTYEIKGLGIKTVPLIEKYVVDVLGNVNKCGKEKRMYFNN